MRRIGQPQITSLALRVALGHFGMPLGFPTSDIAVQSFFVISGFYMALVLNEKYGPGSYWLFISNRLLRLWPTYLVILIPSFVVASNWSPILSLDLASITYYFVSQIFIVGQETYFYLYTSARHARPDAASPAPCESPLQAHTRSPGFDARAESYFYLLALFMCSGPASIGAIIAASVLLRKSCSSCSAFAETHGVLASFRPNSRCSHWFAVLLRLCAAERHATQTSLCHAFDHGRPVAGLPSRRRWDAFTAGIAGASRHRHNRPTFSS